MGEGLTLTRSSYYGARFLAQVSQNLLFAGLFVVAGTSDHAGIGMGNLFVAMLIPAIAFGMVGGVVADRLGPARGYAVGSFLRFASVCLGVVLVDGVVSVWIVAFIYSLASQVFSPAEMAMVKVIDPNKPGRTHSLIVALQTAGQGAGILVLAPALYFLGGPTAIIIGSAGGYAILTGITIFLAVRCSEKRATTSARKQLAFRETFAFFGAESRARDAVAVLALKVVASRAIMVAIPIYLERDLRVGQEWIVYLLGVGVVGAVAGLVWASRTMTLERAPSTMRLAAAGFAVGAFALAALDYTLTLAAGYSGFHPIQVLEAQVSTTYLVAFPVAFLLGLCVSGAMVSARVALTETAPEGMQARVFATQLWLTETLILLPLALAGIGTEVAGARPTLAVVAGLAVLTLGAMEFGRIRERLTPRPEPALATVPID
ncbi:MAG: MFS transporter [Dehalococcoidia bacterium]